MIIDTIKQGGGLDLVFMAEVILLILAFFTIKAWFGRKRQYESFGEWLQAMRERQLDARMRRQINKERRSVAKGWLEFQASDLSPTGHRGWRFNIGKRETLWALIQTVTGEMAVRISWDAMQVSGDVFHKGAIIAQSRATGFDGVHLMANLHKVTAALIRGANLYIDDYEKAMRPENLQIDNKNEVFSFTPLDPLKETQPAGRAKGRFDFCGGEPIPHLMPTDNFNKDNYSSQDSAGIAALRALSNSAASAGDTDWSNPAFRAVVLQSGYEINGSYIVCPYHQHTASANLFERTAIQKLGVAGIKGAIQFKYPDREAIVKPSTDQRRAMIAAIQANLHQYDLKEMPSITDDNCVACPYEEGSDSAKEFIGVVRGRCLAFAINPTFTYPSSVTPLLGKKLKEIPEFTKLAIAGAGTAPVVEKHKFNEAIGNGWAWDKTMGNNGATVSFFKDTHEWQYIIIMECSNIHESDADEDYKLGFVIATLYIAPADWEEASELRRLASFEECDDIEKMSVIIDNLGELLESVAWRIRTALGGRFDEFYANLECPYGDVTKEQREANHDKMVELIGELIPEKPTGDANNG